MPEAPHMKPFPMGSHWVPEAFVKFLEEANQQRTGLVGSMMGLMAKSTTIYQNEI